MYSYSEWWIRCEKSATKLVKGISLKWQPR
jgi:hypothetical protein